MVGNLTSEEQLQDEYSHHDPLRKLIVKHYLRNIKLTRPGAYHARPTILLERIPPQNVWFILSNRSPEGRYMKMVHC